MKWFGPVGWPVTMGEVDFRKGGRWRMAMTGPSGQQNTPFGGEYLEIVPNRGSCSTTPSRKPVPGP